MYSAKPLVGKISDGNMHRQARAGRSRTRGLAAHLAHSAGHSRQCGGVEGGRQCTWALQKCDEAVLAALLAQVRITSQTGCHVLPGHIVDACLHHRT